ncbi:MAG TPA: acetyl-CoA C-acetyltransferase, partial [Thermomicrobiales bacterium]|nr:acetyl-CoA C-acetyltransferase [Thermomicrobiales bacterium]
MTQAVILGGARTPFGKLNGALARQTSVDLGGHAIAAAMERSGVASADIQHVIMGQVLQGGVGQIPARQAAFAAGLDKTVTAETINRVCGSGMRAVSLAALQITGGWHDVIVAGGMESMTHAPYFVRNARQGYRMGDGAFEDMMIVDGLFCALEHVQMGLHGDTVAAELKLSREAQDAWALRSHMRAIAAIDNGIFSEEIAPVTIADRKGSVVVDTDEAPRRETSAEALAKLKPVFSPTGTVTAGNAPGVNDGAAALVISSDTWATDHHHMPLATILAQAEAAWGAAYLAKTPVMAANIALKRAGLKLADIDLFEFNEAFANVALNSARELCIDESIVNVNGGAVALGHPIGASGARLVLTLALELRRRGGGIGLAGICSGGGQGDAIIIQVP